MKNFLSICFFTLLFLHNALSQEAIIYLINPSFEGVPREGSQNGPMIDGWYDCGFPGETTPDVHPKKNSAFGVTTFPAHGKTYLGMVVRDNETWERVSQRLSSPLLAGVEYEFRISLARSLSYESPSKTKAQVVNFATPSKLRLWGGNSICAREELLAESDVIVNNHWLDYSFILNPSTDYKYLIFEAFYRTPTPFPYNGNILLDNASDIIPVDADSTRLTETDSITKTNNKFLETVPIVYSKNDSIEACLNLTRFEFTEQHMGTEFKIVLYTESDSLAQTVSSEAFARIAELEQVFSDYREDSEVSQLSALAGTGEWKRASNDLWNVLIYARQVTDRSKGAFDFTVGALTKLWRKAFRQGEMPSETAIQEALNTVGFKQVKLDKQKVSLLKTGTRLDFGGVAKGYAVDEALKVLKKRAVPIALVDGGGDIAVGNPPPNEIGWKVERTVYGEDGQLTKQPMTMANQAIATSGSTERYLEHDGKRYSHIIDPRTGYGVTKQGIVSVVAPTCAEADAWATALSVEVGTNAYMWLKKQGVLVYFSE